MTKKTKCSFCKKKTGLINYSCSCGGTFCQKHRYTHAHDCPCVQEKKEKTKESIKQQNPKTQSSKLQKV